MAANSNSFFKAPLQTQDTLQLKDDRSLFQETAQVSLVAQVNTLLAAAVWPLVLLCVLFISILKTFFSLKKCLACHKG